MSTELFFPTSRSRRRLRTGPLAHDIDGFAAWLAAEGYAYKTARMKLWLTRNVSCWLEQQGLGIEALNERRFDAFQLSRGGRRPPRDHASTGRQLLRYLRDNSRVPPAASDRSADDPIGRIPRRHERFLVNERGLSSETVRRYLPIVRAFLIERFGTRPVALESLAAQDANRFILRHSQGFSRAHAKMLATVLRSFLRYLLLRGDISVNLAAAVLPVMHWRLSGLPKALAPEQVESILSHCDRTTSIGRRDYAILLLLARLGLRAGDVVAMTLDDFDWHNALVTVSGKGLRREALPLPQQVGEAVVAYLRNDRPACSTRRLFIRQSAPHRGLRSSAAIGDLVRRALGRAGIDPHRKGAHLLRHSLATGMLRNGASLEDIGQILRHRHPQSTQIYAKLDLEALRELAPAWPGGAA